MSIKLLDCTLRDGGSVNKWNFGHDNIITILQNLNDSGMEIVEIGFLQDGYNNSYDLSIADNTKSFDEKLKLIKNKKFKSVAMINLGKFDINKLPDKSSTLIDGIRLMFKKQDLKTAVEYSKIIKDKGFSISLNPVSVTSYYDDDLKALCETANSLQPDIIYLIDTYGLLGKKRTLSYFEKFNKYLDSSIEIGYHAHNNLQLAFSNSIEIINNKGDRNIVIDGSLYGMGKRAGNTPIELLVHYLNDKCGSKYDIDIINETIEKTIMPLHERFEWGYSLVHCIAAINGCHSDYVTYLYKDKKLHLKRIQEILQTIPADKKLTFDKHYAEI